MIPSSEFAGRRNRARQAVREAGLAGLLVCSRGGGTTDRYADVKYLTNFYTRFPYIPDVPGEWTGRAHAFVILPADGEPVLVADDRPERDSDLAIGDVTVTGDVTGSVIAAMKKAGLAEGRIGIAGSDTLPWSLHNALAAALPEITWSPADDILGRLRMVKSPGEIAMLRRASQVGSRATEAMLESAVPGATHGEVVAAGMEVLVTAGGILYNSFMSSGKGGNNPAIASSSFPTWGSDDVLEDGDWFHVGISGAVDGYYFDHARSKPVGHATAEQIRVFEAPLLAVREAMAVVRPGVTAADIARAGREKLESLGFELEGSFKGFGHGIGLGWDSPWLVESDHTLIEENMVLCVERSVRHMGYVGDFEETVVVTKDGHELLTDARVRWW
ncbi:MAG: Xaa-Pro peptidase family protein [bacterium]|nr:Xaa-Pro peptidase family protein [bacterium]